MTANGYGVTDEGMRNPTRIDLIILLGLLILAGATIVAWLLVAGLDARWSAACVLTVAVGGVLWWLARLSTAGVVLWCLTVVVLSAVTWVPQFGMEEGLILGEGLILLGLVGSLASSIVFLVAAARDPLRRRRNCAGGNLALFTLIAWGVVCINSHNQRQRQEAIRHTNETLISLHKLGAEVEVIRARIGRLPQDTKELVTLRGKPLPEYVSYSVEHAEGRYYLSCSFSSFWGCAWDLFGWIAFYEGPNSPRPFYVTLF